MFIDSQASSAHHEQPLGINGLWNDLLNPTLNMMKHITKDMEKAIEIQRADKMQTIKDHQTGMATYRVIREVHALQRPNPLAKWHRRIGKVPLLGCVTVPFRLARERLQPVRISVDVCLHPCTRRGGRSIRQKQVRGSLPPAYYCHTYQSSCCQARQSHSSKKYQAVSPPLPLRRLQKATGAVPSPHSEEH